MDTMEYVLTGFFLIHGILHAWVGSGMTKDSSGNIIGWNGNSWLLKNIISEQITKRIGLMLYGITTIGFIGSGIGVLIQQDWWIPLAIISAAIGFVILAITWKDLQPIPSYYVLGPFLNVIIIMALLMGWGLFFWIIYEAITV